MIIIWRRWGWLGLLFPVLGFFLWVAIAALLRAALHDPATQGWWNVIGLVIGFGAASVGGWFFSTRVIDRKLDDPTKTAVTSTLFFMPVRWWAFVAGGLGLVFLIPNLVDLT